MSERTRAVRKKPSATLRDVVANANKVERLTGDPERVIAVQAEGEQLSSLIFGLVDLIIGLPRAATTLQKRLARAEAENVREFSASLRAVG